MHRLRERFTENTRIFTAGDSLFDLSLLAAAGIAFCPQALQYMAREGQQVITVDEKQGIFSDVIVQELRGRSWGE